MPAANPKVKFSQRGRPPVYDSPERWIRMILSVTPSATTAEIAQATEINYHTVKKIVGRIRADMKRALVTAIDQSHENPPDATKSEPLVNSTLGAAGTAKPGSSARVEEV